VDASGCPFRSYRPGESLVHGDACLPNIVAAGDGTVNGHIDLSERGVGDIVVDL